MKVEYLIFFYMAVSILMGVFEFCFLLYEMHRDRSFERKSRRMAAFLGHEIEVNADFPTEEHKRSIFEKMKRLSGLESFDLTIEQLVGAELEKGERYLLGITDVFEKLARYFSTKDDLHKAYFAYIVRRWYRLRPASGNMISTLLRYVNEGSLYARQNALEALAEVGNPGALVEALVILESYVDFHHPKLITEIAMAFKGSTPELARELERRFDEFRPAMQTAIINFARMVGQGDTDRYLRLLQDEREDTEVRLACMRYFTRHPHPAAASFFREKALSEDAGQWECAAVATSALGSYRDDETVDVLVQCLRSPQWYVRFNAAKTLYDAGLSLDDPRLKSLMEGGDRYAREMLSYRWEIESIAGAGAKAPKLASADDGAAVLSGSSANAEEAQAQ